MKKQCHRLVHISDVHFSLLNLNPLQFFSKTAIGHFNWLLNRRKVLCTSPHESFFQYVKDNRVDTVAITGDITTTSTNSEFALAIDFVEKLKESVSKVYIIPGNHDVYTSRAMKTRRFYEKLKGNVSFKGALPYSLEKDHVAAFELTDNYQLVLVDCARYISLFSSEGDFSQKVETNLIDLLKDLKQYRCLVACHFPCFKHKEPKAWLRNASRLYDILLQHPQIVGYLHGHAHIHTIANLANNNPIFCDAGSLSNVKQPSFNVFELDDNQLSVYGMQLAQNNTWSTVLSTIKAC